jgi:DNA-binding transcriptional MerR regulator
MQEPSTGAPTHLTIGQLASRCQVSRTTILYYEQVALVAPVGRSEAGYRLYSQHELARVQQICAWRAAGLGVEAIRTLLGGGDQRVAIARRLDEIERSLERLREQQAVLVQLLDGNATAPDPVAPLAREKGLDDAAMLRWHTVFERQNPQGHKAFLLALGLSEEEVARLARDRVPGSRG